jgi:transposase
MGLRLGNLGDWKGDRWIGYKIHVAETCEPDQVQLITKVETTAAVSADGDESGR